MTTLDEALAATPFAGYVYSYPHKTAYRALPDEPALPEVWENEPHDSLFLYLHVPFCEFRCGFCNLFTRAIPPEELVSRYLQQLRAEAERVRDALDQASNGTAQFARLAIGGGTPTYLNENELHELLTIARQMGVQPERTPIGIECSPATATRERLQILKQFGVDRVSIGIQSFDDQESAAIGRPQDSSHARDALDRIQETGFPIRNIDLIYGGDGQSVNDFCDSIRQALRWSPEELYLYPLYVRPLTGLGRTGMSWDDHRLDSYRAGRDLLRSEGYEQVSMRMFRRTNAPDLSDPPYTCQSDGMIGLGCGSRSYTQSLHYSTEYAVGRSGVHEILDDYVQRDPNAFLRARHGFVLDIEDQQRRHAILSLLQVDGLDLAAFHAKFQCDVFQALPELTELCDPIASEGGKPVIATPLAQVENGRLQLTETGLERSDAIGPWLFSKHVRERMEQYTCR